MLPVSALEALAGSWSRILGAVRPEGRMPHPLQGFSSPCSHPDIISDISGRISSVSGLCQVVMEIFSMTALEIILDPCPGLSGRLFLVEKIAIAWHPVIDLSHPNEFVLQSPFMIETVASVLLAIREGDFLASVALNNGCFLYPIFRIRGSFSWFPVMWGSLPVRGPVSWTVDCP